jgi:hypothetical protein
VTPGLHSWSTPLQALALIVSPRLGLQHLTFVMAYIPIGTHLPSTMVYAPFETHITFTIWFMLLSKCISLALHVLIRTLALKEVILVLFQMVCKTIFDVTY